jgi:3-methyladenine DNA glycosylase Mpg
VSRASGADVAEGDQTLGELLSMRRQRSGLADSVGEGKLKDGQTYDANRTSGPRIGIPQGRIERRRGIAKPIRRYFPGSQTVEEWPNSMRGACWSGDRPVGTGL